MQNDISMSRTTDLNQLDINNIVMLSVTGLKEQWHQIGL